MLVVVPPASAPGAIILAEEAGRAGAAIVVAPERPAVEDLDLLASPRLWRAWCYLVLLSWQRQARARQMVWIALGLLAFSAALIAINTAADRWGAVPRSR